MRPSRTPFVVDSLWWVLACALLLLTGGFGLGCKGCEVQSPLSVDPALALLPAQTQTIVSIDLQQVRTSVLWNALSSATQGSAEDLKILGDLKVRTGFDPLVDLRRLVFAFPEDARVKGEFAMVAYGEHMDERRLVSYARDEAKSRGFHITQEEREGRRMWVGSDKLTARAGFFVDSQTFVLGGGGWAEKVAALVENPTQPSVARSAELSHLSARVGLGHAAWAAAVVPGATRTRLGADPKFAAAANIARVAVSLDLKNGLVASARAELSTKESATALTGEINNYIREAKQSPKLLLMGVGPWLDGLVARSEGPLVQIELKLDAAQAQSMADRLAALMKLARK